MTTTTAYLFQTTPELLQRSGLQPKTVDAVLAYIKIQNDTASTPLMNLFERELITLEESLTCLFTAMPAEITKQGRQAAVLLAICFAEHVLPIFEEQFPKDMRPRRALQTARMFLKEEVGVDDLCAAYEAAAWPAAEAAWAAWAACAASTAPLYAAYAEAAAYAASTASIYAARAAYAPYASSAAAIYAARAAEDEAVERAFQFERLLEVLRRENPGTHNNVKF